MLESLRSRLKGRASPPAVAAAATTSDGRTAGFMGSGQLFPSPAANTFFMRWNPALRDAQEDVRASWVRAAARATDAIQNSGWIAGGVRQAVNQMIGTGLRLNAKVDTTVIKFVGVKDPAGNDLDPDGWCRFVERRWEAWSKDKRACSYSGKSTIAQMTTAAVLSYFATGEAVALTPYVEAEADIPAGTKVQPIPSHRLSQRSDASSRLVQGIRTNARGRPIAYIFQTRAPNAVTAEVEIPARDGVGRSQVIHVAELREGQYRGITPLVASLKVTRQFDQLADATLTAAMIQTIFAATVESELPTGDFLNALQDPSSSQGIGGSVDEFLTARMGFHQGADVDIGEPGKIAHLFPGESLKFNKSEHPNGSYEAFARFLLREIARGLGVTYEQLTGDYTDATYSSVRMAIADIWNTVLWRREHIAAAFLQPIYEAWLEEEIEAGRIVFPGGIDGFFANRSAACKAEWKGPPKPQADDVKAAKAHQTYREMGVISDSDIANDLGRDIEDVYEDRLREKNLREKMGLPEVGPSVSQTVAQISADAVADAAEEEDDPVEPEPA